MNAYTPRRCGKRWLDGDCPKEILAIFDHPKYPSERFDVFYTGNVDGTGREYWLQFFNVSEAGAGYHGEMKAHEVAAYRYREKRHYTRWSTLPDAVKAAVRRDLEVEK